MPGHSDTNAQREPTELRLVGLDPAPSRLHRAVSRRESPSSVTTAGAYGGIAGKPGRDRLRPEAPGSGTSDRRLTMAALAIITYRLMGVTSRMAGGRRRERPGSTVLRSDRGG